MYKILERIFRDVKPFCIHLYERMDGTHYSIGIKYNKFGVTGIIEKKNSLGIFYGRRYRCFQWLDKTQ